MRFVSAAQIDELVTRSVVESASLEFKQELELRTTSQRSEVLKDLSGMANGGGTVVYGVEEDSSQEWPAAVGVMPLSDVSLQAKLESIVRDGVQPPLLVEYSPIPYGAGYVLAVDVRRSPVGPYMVEAYGDRRYYRRTGTSVTRMTEQEVRDAYALGMRAVEQRPFLWASRGLSAKPTTEELWLTVSALPEEPHTDMFDLRLVTADDLMPPEQFMAYINNWQVGDLTTVLRSLSLWADGFHGADRTAFGGSEHLIRVDRDGASVIATSLRYSDGEPVPTVVLFRIMNTALLYLGWLWEKFSLSNAVEIRTELHNARGLVFVGANQVDGRDEMRSLDGPSGVSLDPVSTAEYVVPWQLRRASDRHRVVLRFADRLHQGLGEPQAEAPFRRGVLYDRNGASTELSVHPCAIWDALHQAGSIATVHSDGAVSANSTGEIVAWHLDGVIVDLAGDAVAVVELAPGVGCPDNFVATSIAVDPEGAGRLFGGRPSPHAKPQDPPGPTGNWSAIDIRSLLSA